MIFDLAETGRDVIGMDDNVNIMIQDSEVVCLDEDFFLDIAELEFELRSLGQGGL